MKKNILSDEELSSLIKRHNKASKKREADKLKAVILAGQGWTGRLISSVLMIDEDTVSSYLNKYREGGAEAIEKDGYSGKESYLSKEEISEFRLFLEENIVRSADEAIKHVEEKYSKKYGRRGMEKLLKRLGFVYKKTKTFPGKADREKQNKFIEEYREILKKSGEDPVYFADAAHPRHNVQNGFGRIKKTLHGKFRQTAEEKELT